jgi:hypothetical protein
MERYSFLFHRLHKEEKGWLKSYEEISRDSEDRQISQRCKWVMARRFQRDLKFRRGKDIDSKSQEHRIYTWYRVSRTREFKPQRLCSQSSEITRHEDNRAIRCGGRMSRDSHLANSGIGGVKRKSFDFTSGEGVKDL